MCIKKFLVHQKVPTVVGTNRRLAMRQHLPAVRSSLLTMPSDWMISLNMKILLVEDDLMIAESIQGALAEEGFLIDWVGNGSDADAALAGQQYDAMLLDLGLPKKDGIDVLRGMRARHETTPVLVITARDTIAERVSGLNYGADDYLVKPFDLHELIARLRAVVRRARGQLESVYQHNNILLNSATREASIDGRQAMLSAREWAILDALIARPGAICSRAHLEQRLYGWSGEVESNAVEVYIHGLRKKLGHDFIVNVRGVGYMVAKSE
jgi:DNA-binding response OmpR family regulator